MRLWTLHPQYLDSRGLVALWREALLAQKVLQGQTRGYRHHPQLQRFQASSDPMTAIAAYLHGVWAEADARGYFFDATKIAVPKAPLTLEASSGQMRYEWTHLMAKLQQRAPEVAVVHERVKRPRAHPLFHVGRGPVATWEKV